MPFHAYTQRDRNTATHQHRITATHQHSKSNINSISNSNSHMAIVLWPQIFSFSFFEFSPSACALPPGARTHFAKIQKRKRERSGEGGRARAKIIDFGKVPKNHKIGKKSTEL